MGGASFCWPNKKIAHFRRLPASFTQNLSGSESGYYDADEDGSAIAQWLENTRGIRGIAGAMYTTWEDRYGAMDAWAQKAWGSPP